MNSRTYLAIDLKSFYASVECVARGLDALTTNLVVADPTRTDKTICLAVTPSLKSYGIPGRARLFEVVRRVREINVERARKAVLRESSTDNTAILADPSLKLDYIVAPPRMAHYMEVSARIYEIYLKYVSSEDIHVYSIDEVFIDATDYLRLYGITAHELAMRMIRDVLKETGITATAGIGTNLYLAKIAMDIEAKHSPADKDGVRIAELDEMSYRQKYWSHRPLTDFWRVGRGIAARLEANGMYTLGDVARCSLQNEEKLYKLFGVNAELLIDHAWGWEPCTIDLVKAYRPETNSFSSGQVLHCPYDTKKARVIVQEMADGMALKLVDRHLVTDQLVLTVNYDRENLTNPDIRSRYDGDITKDYYGRLVPKHGHGTARLEQATSSSTQIIDSFLTLYDRIVNPILFVRRLTLTVNNVVKEKDVTIVHEPVQLDLFTDYAAEEQKKKENAKRQKKERSIQEARLKIKRQFGKNAILKGINFEEGATARERNAQIGGHKA
jgi:DNA polymerase V